MNNNIHATLISFKKKGILFIGPSGVGKSDLALRMIVEHRAKLVADDRVNLTKKNNYLYGSASETIAGKIEARGVGILTQPYVKQQKISLCVELVKQREAVERLPDAQSVELMGVLIPKIKLYAFDCSTICKIILKICGIIS